jgi:Zinc dependent phospholipase C
MNFISKIAIKKTVLLTVVLIFFKQCFCWGFFAHQKINYYAVFLLPPEMMVFYKSNIDFIKEHAVDPDKRRYAIAEEAPRHYIDMDRYGNYPYNDLPRNWDSAISRFSADTLQAYGIVPWWIQIMQQRLTNAFKEKNQSKILRLSAEIGHYIADAHVPLHACSNHNGQFTNQRGIHGFWESRLPELLADKEWNFFIGQANYITNTSQFMWNRIVESAAAADTVLGFEKNLSQQFNSDQRFSFEDRNGMVVRQYSTAYSVAYNKMLKGMVERRMRQSIYAIASFWYTAWVNAGQPDLRTLNNKNLSEEDAKELKELNQQWKKGAIKGKSCDAPQP